MVLTRSKRQSPYTESSDWKLKTPKIEVQHDHHASKPSQLAKKDSYQSRRRSTNADEIHAACVEPETLKLCQGKQQTTPLMSPRRNAPLSTTSASQREGYMVHGNINDAIKEGASNFFQKNKHYAARHENLATLTADMDSSQRKNNVAPNVMQHFTPKPSEAAIAVPYLKEDLYELHSALATGETHEPPDQGVSKLYDPLLSSLWDIPTGYNKECASSRNANMVLGNINYGVEEKVSNIFQRNDHHDPSLTKERISLNAAVVQENLTTNDTSPALENSPRDSPHQPCTSYNMTEIAEQLFDDDDDDADSAAGDRSLVSVEGYKVKPQHANILRSILSKHGDIAANCSHKSENIRSYFMQSVCDVIHELRDTSLTDISEGEIERKLSFLDDIEGACVEVAWLKRRLHEIREAKLAIPMLRSSSELKRVHIERKSKIQRTKNEMNILEEKIRTLRSELAADEDEVQKTEKLIAEYKRKLKHIFKLESLDHGLV